MISLKTRRVTVRYQWDRLRVSFWFAPFVMSLTAILLAWMMYILDSLIPSEILQNSRFILSGTPDEFRTMLISMAGTILATAGVVFTLLTLPLSTVAAQYGSRLLRVFLSDRTTQIVLGTFVGTFVYCLAAAVSIPSSQVEPTGRQITATFGLYLVLASFASLILLIQHISTMLQAPNIAAAAGAELRDVVLSEGQGLIKTKDGVKYKNKLLPDLIEEQEEFQIRVTRGGYIQYIDPEYLLALVQENDLVIQILRGPGTIVWRDSLVAKVWPAESITEELERRIRNAFRIGNNRTPTQDVGYGVNQLVEMAVRAMSPAINDPFTAMTCLSYIGEGLALFIKQGEKGSLYYDRDHQLRLILETITFPELIKNAFDMIRHASRDNASVMIHLLEVINSISKEVDSKVANLELFHQVNLIMEEANAGSIIESDCKEITQICMEISNSLQC
jgi:uncharacterized membrane protein